MKKILWIIRNIEALIGMTALSLMILLCCTNVVLRFIFNASQVAISEYTAICMTWAVFLGAAEAYKRNQHFGMEFVLNKLPVKWRMRLRQLLTLVLLGLFAFLTYHSFAIALSTSKLTSALMISYFWIDLPAALGFLSMAVHAGIHLVHSFVKPEAFAQRYASSDGLTDSVPPAQGA